MGGRRAGIPNKKSKLVMPTTNIVGLCSNGEFDRDLWWQDTPDTDTGFKATRVEVNKCVDNSRLALKICDMCPSKSACLTEGMRHENLEWGIWGGLTSGERLLRANAVGADVIRKRKVNFSNKIRSGMK
jgi:hypothetical protein